MKSLVYIVFTAFLYMVNLSNLFAQDINPVSNLDGVCSDGTLTLTWSKPNEIMIENIDWLIYYNSKPYSNLGFYCLCDIICAQRWSPANFGTLDLTHSSIITKLRFFSNIDWTASTSFFIKIYQGESSIVAGEEIFSQEIPKNLIIKGGWTEIDLVTPFVIDITKELWIGLASINSGWGLAACDSGPIIPSVNKIFLVLHGSNYGTWTNLEQLGFDLGNFMFETLVITEKGFEVEVNHYDIYQDDILFGETTDTIYSTTYIENEHNYCIVAVYSEEKQSEKKCKEIICETGLDDFKIETLFLYPNPTFKFVTIDTPNFWKVEIYNTFGQLLQTSSSKVIDLSSYNSGIYFFKVFDTESYSIVKQIVVAK